MVFKSVRLINLLYIYAFNNIIFVFTSLHYLKFYRATGENMILAELHEDMGEFQSWLDKAEYVTALPIEPDHREQLNTALEKVQVEPFLNPQVLLTSIQKT